MSTAVATRASLVEKFATKYSIEPSKLMTILKATAFKVSQGEVSNEQMAALMVVADQYGLNPFTREIFAFEDKRKGVVPVVSVDGWSRIINDHKDFNGMEFAYGPEIDAPEGGKKAHQWIECTMHHKGRTHPVTVREHFDEVYQPPRGGFSGPWQSHPKRMHRHKALIQAARLAFGFSGIYEEDEAQRIIEAGGGVVMPPEAGDRAVEGTVQTRTGGLAADLAARAKSTDVEDAIQAQPEPAKSAESIAQAIGAAKSQADLQPMLQDIMKLPDGPERVQLMKTWNAAVMALKVEQQAAQAAPEHKVEAKVAEPKAEPKAEPASGVPAAFAGQPEKKPADPAPKKAAKAAEPAKTPGDDPLSKEAAELVCQSLRDAADADKLEEIADRENSKKWPRELRNLIYAAYSERFKQLSAT